jgi:hypothetical protein
MNGSYVASPSPYVSLHTPYTGSSLASGSFRYRENFHSNINQQTAIPLTCYVQQITQLSTEPGPRVNLSQQAQTGGVYVPMLRIKTFPKVFIFTAISDLKEIECQPGTGGSHL